MQLVDDGLRIREDPRVERELTVVRVPARGTEARAQVDQRLARQLFLAEGPRFLQEFLAARERAMRLLIPERPHRRQRGEAGQGGVLRHHAGRIARADDEDVHRQPLSVEPRVGSGEVERSERPMDEHRPAARADHPLDRDAAAVRPQLIPALTAAHPIGGSPPIELWPAFAESENRSATQREGDGPGALVHAKGEGGTTVSRPNLDADRRDPGLANVARGRDDGQLAARNGSPFRQRREPRRRRGPRSGDERAVDGKRGGRDVRLSIA